MRNDEKFIRRCIELAEVSLNNGGSPFGSVATKRDRVVAESSNEAYVSSDVMAHAEILVMKSLQRKLGTANLDECTIYSNCEPCPMCSFMIRELKFRKVVYAVRSLYMGGHNKWNILEDEDLEKFKPYFSKPPKVVSGVLESEAGKTFKRAGWTKMYNFGN